MNVHALPEVFNNIIKYPSGGANIFTCSDVKRVDNISLHNEHNEKKNGTDDLSSSSPASKSFFRLFCCGRSVFNLSFVRPLLGLLHGGGLGGLLIESFIMMCIELATCKYKLGSPGEKVLEIGRSLSEVKLVPTDR